jgi:hypothetical protein
VPPRKAAARGKISIDEAFHKLTPVLSPHGSVELMNAAFRDNRARLWCDGKVVDPGFIRTHVVVRARLMSKRHWTAEIEATRPLDKPVGSYTWQTDAKQIEKLLPTPANPSPRRKPGPEPKHDWQTHVTREVIRRLLAGERFPKAPEMLQWCGDKWDWQPDIRQMQRHLKDLLG